MKKKHSLHWHILYIVNIPLFISIIILTACEHAPDKQLKHAETIMELYPDSALMILENMKLQDKNTEYDQHLYYVLLAYAKYKNFIDENNDSTISEAADFFISKGYYEESVKALYLSGKIQINGNRFGDAAVSLTKGLNIARENKYLFWEGQCARGLVLLYGKLLDSSAQLKYAKEAYNAFLEGGFQDWADWANMELATAYNNMGQYEKAYTLVKKIEEKSKVDSDSLLLGESLKLLGLVKSNLGDYLEALNYYKCAFELNSTLLSDIDKENISIAYSLVDRDSISLAIKSFTTKITQNNHHSHVVLANNGNFKEAYQSLNEYSKEQDSVFSVILNSNVSESIGKYQDAERLTNKALRQKERWTLGSITFISIIISIFTVLMFKLRVKRNELEKELLISNIDTLKNDLLLQMERSSKSTNLSGNSCNNYYAKIIREKYSEINELCDNYYQIANTKSDNITIKNTMMKIISDFTNPEYLKEVEIYVDSVSINLYSSFKRDFNNITTESRRLFLYYLLGFSPRSISLFLGQKVSAVYNKKSRLKAIISKSIVDRREEYLNILN